MKKYEALGVTLRQVMGLRPQPGGCEKEKSKMPHAELIGDTVVGFIPGQVTKDYISMNIWDEIHLPCL